VEHWAENCYYQYLSGEQVFRPGIPCVPTELLALRKRIGEPGVELILKESIRVNGTGKNDTGSGTVSVDTTVQEKNITYPTDDKLYKKIIIKCRAIAKKESLVVRRSYVRVVKKLAYAQRFRKRKGGAKQARKAARKIRAIVCRLVAELGRKLPLARLGFCLPSLNLFRRVLEHKRGNSNKIYSLHEPAVKCYSKVKEHKKF